MQQIKYDKQQILKSKKFINQRDVLSVVLNDNEMYTVEDVKNLYDEFMKKEVK